MVKKSHAFSPRFFDAARMVLAFAGRGLAMFAGLFVMLGGSSMNAEEGLDAIVASAPEEVASGFQFTEGPAWHPEGFLIFSDIPANRIVKWTGPNKVETFREPSGNSNGLIFDTKGRLIACEHGNRRVSRTEPDGKVVTLADKYDGKRLNSPNDVVVKSDGNIYFTDPPYGIQPAEKELDFNGVFRISPDGKLSLLAKDFDRPNGILLSPDEKTLYVADTARGHVRAFDVQPDGSVKGGKVFCEVPGPDGMSMDVKGNLYVTSTGVAVFGPKGEKIGEINLPERPANCCFGGPDYKTLFVTARTSLYSVRLKVAGLRLVPAPAEK
jgi:gluconolactonase